MISRRRLAVVVLLAAIFALGGAAGRISLWPRRECESGSSERARSCQRGRFVETLDHELSLTPTQRDSVRAILRKWDPSMRAAWDDLRHKFDSLRPMVRADIRQVLTEDQKAGFQRWTAHSDSVRTQQREAERAK